MPSFLPPVVYGVIGGGYPTSVAAADFDLDGNQDLAVTNDSASRVSILRGDGGGTFSSAGHYIAGFSPRVVAVGDFNSDYIPDLAVANDRTVDGTVSVLLGNGDGSFQDRVAYATGASTDAVVVSDFNGDGYQDLAATKYGGTVGVLLGNGDGTFENMVNFPTGMNALHVAVGDFNGDGNWDLVTANFNGNASVGVLLGNGNGTFQPATYYRGLLAYQVAVSDLNGDGHQDLVLAAHQVAVMLGIGNGRFEPATLYEAGSSVRSVTVADFDLDGVPDVLAGNNVFQGAMTLLRGQGDGTFYPPEVYRTGGANPWAVLADDFNYDGYPDAVVANSGSNTASVLLNAGDWGGGAPGGGSSYSPWFPQSMPMVSALPAAGIDAGALLLLETQARRTWELPNKAL